MSVASHYDGSASSSADQYQRENLWTLEDYPANYFRLEILLRELAAAKATSLFEFGVGDATPLVAAAKATDTSTRKRATAGGNALLQKWGLTGQEVLGNVVPNSGGRRGTLHLEISVESDHPQFRREGDANLIVEHRVSLKDALCGFTFELVHLNGRSYKFNCKPCSITGSMHETKVVPGLGYTESGALKIRFSIELPTSLTEEQIAALSSIL